MEPLALNLQAIVGEIEERGVVHIREVMMEALWGESEEKREQARSRLARICPGILRGAYVEKGQMVLHVAAGEMDIKYGAGQVPADYQGNKPHHFIVIKYDN